MPPQCLAGVSRFSRWALCVCVCVSLCVFLGLEVVAAGREQKQRVTTLNSCRNSNLSLTGTLLKAKESISIPATTIPKYTMQRYHIYWHFYCLHDHNNQWSETTTWQSGFEKQNDWWRTVTLWHIAPLKITPQTIISESETSQLRSYIFCVMYRNTKAHVLQAQPSLLVGGLCSVEIIDTAKKKKTTIEGIKTHILNENVLTCEHGTIL